MMNRLRTLKFVIWSCVLRNNVMPCDAIYYFKQKEIKFVLNYDNKQLRLLVKKAFSENN